MPAEHEDEGGPGEEALNPLAEALKAELAKPVARLDRRESVSKLYEQSATFAAFRRGRDPAAEGEGGAADGGDGSPGSNRGEPQRAGSARQWDADSGMRAEAELNAFLQAQGGGSLEQSFASGQVGEDLQAQTGDPACEPAVQADPSMHQQSVGETGASVSGEFFSPRDDSAQWDDVHEDPSADGAGARSIDRDTIIQKHVRGGTVSTYKHKQELQSQLERRAGLKFIRERREQVRARDAVVKQTKEKVAVAQGHVDECISKISKLEAESETLFAADQFGNRDKIKTIDGRIKALNAKLREAQGDLARESEVAYLAQREYDHATIELGKVEELEADLQLEEEYAVAEQRVVAHVRAEKERQAAARFETMRRRREGAAAEQRRRDLDKTKDAAMIARAGRVAAIKRVKEARGQQAKNLEAFEVKRQEDREKRAAALLELKANMEGAADKIRGGNERKYKKIKAVDAQRAADKAEILAAGGNPYAVWRQQEAAKLEEKKAKEREMKMKEMENKLLVQLMKEEQARREQEAVEHHHKLVMKDFQAQMGGAAKQKHTVQYMKERTVGGKDVLDPTGREPRIYPSKATVLMDWKFGLGKEPYPAGAKPGEELPAGHPEGYADGAAEGVDGEGWRTTQKGRIIDKMHAKYPGEGWNQTLVGSKYLDDTLRRPGKADVKSQLEEEEAAMVAMLDAHEAKRQGAVEAEAEAKGGQAQADGEGEGEDESDIPKETLPEATIAKPKEVFAVPEFTGIWDDSAGPTTDSKKYSGTLSKLEQQYLKAAMDRKKAGYGWIEKQVVWGREFKGRAFVPSEKGRDVEAIVFQDFVPGQVYKRKVTLTNASYSFNTFKLLELPDSVKDFFTISYTHPGAISPGITCDLHIKFEPKLNEDIIECIPLLCQTGPQDIPLRCLTKKVMVSTSTPEVELNVIIGESVTRDLVLVNKGCLDCPLTIRQLVKAPDPDSIVEGLAEAAADGHYVGAPEETVQYQVEVVAKGYSTTKIPITFTPTTPTSMEIPLHLDFKKHMSQPQSDDMLVMVRATAFQVPIYVEQELMDLRCCCYGMTYAQTLIVRNRGKVSLKTMPQVPPQLRGFLTFTPDMAYVQARNASGEDGLFAFRLRFEPQPGLLDKCAEFVIAGPTGQMDTIAIPIRVAVPDQVLPVYFTLRVQLTTADIKLSAPELHFGECAISDAVMLRETITNTSLLPQRIGFLKLPRGVSIKPPLGLAALLPGESRMLEITFQPYTDTDFNFPIILTTSANRQIKIPCSCTGVRAPLLLSCSSFQLAPCAPGDRVTQSFFATNESSEPRTLEVIVPKKSGLKLSPVVATIEAGQSVRFNLDFCPVATPPVDLGQPSVADIAKTSPAEDEEGTEAREEAAEDVAVPAQEDEFELDQDGNPIPELDTDGTPVLDADGNAVFKKKAPAEDPDSLTEEEASLRAALLVEETESSEVAEAWSQHSTWQLPIFVKGAALMYVQVKTTTVQPLIVGLLHGSKLTAQVDKNGVETLPVVSFGKLPVGQERVLDIKLSNCCERPEFAIESSVSPLALDPFGPFTILKYPTDLVADQSQTISLSFKPRREAAFTETLVLRSRKNAVRYRLLGHGVSPVFVTEGLVDSSPLNGEGRIDIGDVLKDTSIELPFSLTNNSPFEVSYCVHLNNVGEVNATGIQAFDCVPMEALVQAGESKQLVMSLTADTVSLGYEAGLRIVVPNQKEKMEWRVKGRCWAQAMFAIDASVDALTAGPDVNRFKDQAEAHSDTITLEKMFPQSAAERKEAVSHELNIGNCGSAGAGDFSLDNASEAAALGFQVEPASGKVDAGSKVPVTITYTPPAGGPLSVWNEIVLQGSLRGGTPAAASGSVSLQVRLRGFVPAQL